MRVAIAAALLVLAGCSSNEPAAAPSSSSAAAPTTTRTTPTTTTAKRVPGALADEWDKKFAAARQATGSPPCSPDLVRSPGCASYLTGQVQVVSSLYASLRTREDSGRYARTIAATEKVFDASEAYARMNCGTGGGTVDDCWTQGFVIGTGVVNVGMALRIDDLTP